MTGMAEPPRTAAAALVLALLAGAVAVGQYRWLEPPIEQQADQAGAEFHFIRLECTDFLAPPGLVDTGLARRRDAFRPGQGPHERNADAWIRAADAGRAQLDSSSSM